MTYEFKISKKQKEPMIPGNPHYKSVENGPAGGYTRMWQSLKGKTIYF
jgi:hypothetical protein